MNNRIKEIIASENLSDGEFADLVGIKRSTLSHCLNGRNDVSKDIITKIHKAYPYSSSNLFDSFENSEGDSTGDGKYVKDFRLNTPEIEVQNINKQQDNVNKNVFVDVSQIANLSVSEKKIEKIMVFYSDSTFEVFEK